MIREDISGQYSVWCMTQLYTHSFIYSFIYIFIHLFIYLFVYLFIHLFIYLFIYLLIYLFIYLFVGLYSRKHLNILVELVHETLKTLDCAASKYANPNAEKPKKKPAKVRNISMYIYA